jgi:hypothetical protein
MAIAYNAQAPDLTPEELQIATRKLGAGGKLTPREEVALGIAPDNSMKPGRIVTDVFDPLPTDTATTVVKGKVPAGFTQGPFPQELEQFFGSSNGVLGYRIETLTDENGKTYYQLSVATGPTTSQTYGAGFTRDASGKYITYSPSVSTTSTTNNTKGLKTEAQIAAEAAAAAAKGERQSAYDLLYSQFKLYGLESLVEPLKGLIVSGASPAEFTIKLRESDAYKKRFSANAKRIANGFAAIDEATYLGLEDKYQSIMQNYGLPESYYTRGEMGIQAGFENLIAGNVDPITLEERIMEGQKVVKGSKDIKDAIGQFYPGINNSDFLAYVLDPKNALAEIKRKVAAAEIGGSAIQSGLTTNVGRAEELVAQGITKAQAQQGYGVIGGGLQRGSQLASIYGEDPYTQTTAEKEVFGLTGKTEAEKQRKKLTGLEKATFSGQSGISSGALARDRAGAY